MKKIPLFFASILALATTAPASAGTAAAALWYGDYSYSRLLPRDNGGIVPAIDYALKLDDTGCTIDVTGFQSDEHIRCAARISGNTLTIGFVSYADGRTVNQYNVAVYRPGTRLFTLTRTKAGIITTWGALKPDGVRKAGRFLRRN